MKYRGTTTLLATALAASGAPLLAQDAKPRPSSGLQAEQPGKLTVGDLAPKLAISEWVKGDPITQFEKGHVYVVQFWATWCRPCIHFMPIVSQLQEEYGDKVTIIGVNIWDDPANVAPFMNDRGTQLMAYRVAIEEKDDEADIRNGVMSREWMRAAGVTGIPSAFIVDRAGRIAWHGYSMSLDKALQQVVANVDEDREVVTHTVHLEHAEVPVGAAQTFFGKYEIRRAPSYSDGTQSYWRAVSVGGRGVPVFVPNRLDDGSGMNGSRLCIPMASVTGDGHVLITAEPAYKERRTWDPLLRRWEDQPNEHTGWLLTAYSLAALNQDTPVAAVELSYETDILLRHAAAIESAQAAVDTSIPMATKSEFETTAEYRERSARIESERQRARLAVWRDRSRVRIVDVPVTLGQYNADRGHFRLHLGSLRTTRLYQKNEGKIIHKGVGLSSQCEGINTQSSLKHSAGRTEPCLDLLGEWMMDLEVARTVRTAAPTAITADLDFVMTPEGTYVLYHATIRPEGFDSIEFRQRF